MKTLVFSTLLTVIKAECIDSETQSKCEFPFIFMDATYNSCTWLKNYHSRGPWCSIKVNDTRHHIPQRDTKNWILCDENCPIPSLVCKTPSEECVRGGVLQVCKEINEDQEINEWCVSTSTLKNGTKFINHKECPSHCKGDADGLDGNGLGAASDDCLVYIVSNFVLVGALVCCIIVVIVISCRKKSAKEDPYKVKIKRQSIHPGDSVIVP